ncbi:MAG: hypothetical protein JSS43_19415 [Proteobacteria bacterium]|nr:hypothetical protein [Pseudomonadota bacterium]
MLLHHPAPLLAAASAAEPPPAWFAQLMAQLAAIPERHETFREEKRLAALNRPLLSEGQLIYRRPSYLEKLTILPRKEILLVQDDQLTLTGPDGSPRELSLASRPEIGVLVDAVGGTLSGDVRRLQRSYTVHPSGTLQDWQLALVPIHPRVQEMLRQIVIRGSGPAIRSVLTEQTNGDAQIMLIERSRSAEGPQAFAGTQAETHQPAVAGTARTPQAGPRP